MAGNADFNTGVNRNPDFITAIAQNRLKRHVRAAMLTE